MFDGFPKSMRIGPYTYSIEILDKLDEDDTEATTYGLFTHGVRIKLRQGQKNKIWAVDTVIHEILHGVCDDASLGLKEREVSAIATGLTQVFRDSPEALAWIARTLAD